MDGIIHWVIFNLLDFSPVTNLIQKGRAHHGRSRLLWVVLGEPNVAMGGFRGSGRARMRFWVAKMNQDGAESQGDAVILGVLGYFWESLHVALHMPFQTWRFWNAGGVIICEIRVGIRVAVVFSSIASQREPGANHGTSSSVFINSVLEGLDLLYI